MSTKSSSSRKQSMVSITDFLGYVVPPFLSRDGFSGQLKSPPIIIFSSLPDFHFGVSF